MGSANHPSVPLPTTLPQALERHPVLAMLRLRIARSRAHFEAVLDLLPTPLAEHLLAGPADDGSWVLLATNPSVAAKLRHLVPVLEARLAERGWEGTAIKVRVQRPQLQSHVGHKLLQHSGPLDDGGVATGKAKA
jgi:hypothetical protein